MKLLVSAAAASLMLVSLAAGKPVESPEEAVDAFRAVWRKSLARKLEARPFIGLLKHQVFEDGKVEGKASTSEEQRKLVLSTLTEKEEKESILYGVLDDLKPDRKVWTVTHAGGAGSGFRAIIDAEDGDLVFFWVPPEG